MRPRDLAQERPGAPRPARLGAGLLWLGVIGLGVVGPGLAGCRSTQRWPGPMKAAQDPLPPGDIARFLPGPEEVIVWRHGDPVRVRPAGLASAFPLAFYDKDIRVTAGSWVFTDAGGRAEVQWPQGTSIVLFDHGTGVVGSPSRGEPIFYLLDVTRARISLQAGDQVRLVGGALFSADTGPFLLDRLRPDVVRLSNRSKGTGRLELREERFELDPGEVIDIPLLSAGGDPIQDDPGLATLAGPGFSVDVYGEVERLPFDEEGFHLRADGENEIRGLGVRVRLAPGESVVFEGLRASRPVPTSESEAVPAAVSEPGTDR